MTPAAIHQARRGHRDGPVQSPGPGPPRSVPRAPPDTCWRIPQSGGRAAVSRGCRRRRGPPLTGCGPAPRRSGAAPAIPPMGVVITRSIPLSRAATCRRLDHMPHLMPHHLPPPAVTCRRGTATRRYRAVPRTAGAGSTGTDATVGRTPASSRRAAGATFRAWGPGSCRRTADRATGRTRCPGRPRTPPPASSGPRCPTTARRHDPGQGLFRLRAAAPGGVPGRRLSRAGRSRRGRRPGSRRSATRSPHRIPVCGRAGR